MNINNVIKKQTTVIALTVIGICIGLLGISYAIFFKVNDSTNNQTVSSGSLVVQFGEGSKITTEMLPQTDEEGMATTGYSFSVTNKGSLDMLYDIFIYNDPDASNATNNIMLPHQYIKVSIDGSDPILLSELEDSGVTITSDSNYSSYNLTGENNIKRVVGKDIFVRAAGSGKDVNTHIIKLWITEDAPTSIIGNTVALEIQVFGEADKYVPNIASQINDLYKEGKSDLVADDYNNIRYIGADPANYIYFNCDDYSNPSAETCEKWRIIGSFKDIEDSEGQTAERVKIMRDESIGNIAWDSNGINNWATATLNTYLNGDYLNGDDYNSLKNDITKNMIDSVVWNLGGAPTYTSASNGLAKHFYIYERGTSVYGSNYSPTWTGKIALMYPSDYGYATSGGSTTNREACLNKELSSWDSVSDCYNNDYIFDSSNAQWTLTHDSYDSYYAFGVHRLGNANSGGADSDCSVRPVLYLESSAVIVSGDGSEASPYVLGA